MFFNQASLRTFFLMCFVLLTQAQEPKCKNLGKCTCMEQTSNIFVKCTGASTDDIQRDFFQLLANGDRYYELEISDSDLEGFGELPEHMHPQILKFVDVKNLPLEKLKELINSVTDIKQLTVDGVPMPKVTRELFGDKHKLEILSLNSNGIEDIADDAFEHYHSLKMLSLENNKFSKIPKAVLTTPAESLILKLNENPITQVGEEELKIIKEKQVQLFLNSIDCSCTYKDSPFMKWTQETNSEAILCSSPKNFKGTAVSTFMDGGHCSGTGGPVLLSSFLLVFALYISHLLK